MDRGMGMWRQGIRDYITAAGMWQLWSHMAVTDITMHYRRSAIGPFWLTLQMSILVLALSVVYSALFRQDLASFLPFVASGILAWTYMSMVITEGCRVFINNAPLILHTNLPLTVVVFREVARISIVFIHNIAAVAVIYMIFPNLVSINLLWLIPGFIIFALNGVWVISVLAMISTRYRDMPQMLASLMQVAMFVTPIFWPTSSIPNGRLIIHGNIFYHFIELIRAPILGSAPTNENLTWTVTTTIIGGLLALFTYARYRPRIVFCL